MSIKSKINSIPFFNLINPSIFNPLTLKRNKLLQSISGAPSVIIILSFDIKILLSLFISISIEFCKSENFPHLQNFFLLNMSLKESKFKESSMALRSL